MEAFETAEHFVVVAGNEVDRNVFGNETHYVFYHHHVGGGPVAFAELPDVYYVPVEYEGFWFYALQIPEELGGVAAISSEMNV